uniref:Uncharacterized protein n=1 Tax=Rousettus aegyptiacus TaxID=9407 RepID=A0A7J8CI15_ROUAE|nr:hypothetical protein HJG63_009022 [Rousettus aegyptiacus]
MGSSHHARAEQDYRGTARPLWRDPTFPSLCFHGVSTFRPDQEDRVAPDSSSGWSSGTHWTILAEDLSSAFMNASKMGVQAQWGDVRVTQAKVSVRQPPSGSWILMPCDASYVFSVISSPIGRWYD